MWVRSQDKESLRNYQGFYKKDNSIYGDNYSWFPLGTYVTEERIIEILDDIQKELKNYQPASKYQYITVYEMPEK